MTAVATAAWIFLPDPLHRHNSLGTAHRVHPRQAGHSWCGQDMRRAVAWDGYSGRRCGKCRWLEARMQVAAAERREAEVVR